MNGLSASGMVGAELGRQCFAGLGGGLAKQLRPVQRYSAAPRQAVGGIDDCVPGARLGLDAGRVEWLEVGDRRLA